MSNTKEEWEAKKRESANLLYNLPFHEATWLPDWNNTAIRRVPGGWLYMMNHKTDNPQNFPVPQNVVFVPFSSEFDPNKEA